MNAISMKIMNRFFGSTNCLKKFNQIIVCNEWKAYFSTNYTKIRYISSKTTPKVLKIEPIGRKSSIQTNNELSENSEQKAKQQTLEAIGIVGIHKWEELKNVKEWICFYHFPYINNLRVFQRLKLYLTLVNFALVPGSLALYSCGSVELDVVTYYSMVSLFSMFATYVFGHLFSHFVGRIYVSSDAKYVRLSHLSFFGNRIDTDFEREDVVPLMDTNAKIDDWYCAIERYSTSYKLYMSLKYGGIVNREAFEQVFGEDAIKHLTQTNRS